MPEYEYEGGAWGHKVNGKSHYNCYVLVYVKLCVCAFTQANSVCMRV